MEESAATNNQQLNSIIPKQTPRFSPPLIATFVLLVFIGAVAGFLLGKSLSQPKTSPPPISQFSPSPSPENPIPTPTPTIDPTANWKTYVNNKYNYSIKYPEDWILQPDKQTPEEIVNFTKDLNSLTIYSGSATPGVPPESTPSQVKSIVIANQNVIKEAYNNLFVLLKFPENLPVNQISIRYKNGITSAEYEDLFDLILSTFKFLDETPTPTTDPTANWKIYTNNELSFKYPPSWTAETHRIIANNPNIVIYIATGGSTLMNECMKLEKIEKKDNLVIKKFAGITAGEMCSTNDVNSREIWIIPSENAYSPGISYNYSTKDNPQAEDLFDLILSTFKFLD